MSEQPAFDPVVLLLILGVSCIVGSWIVSMVDDWPAIRARRQLRQARKREEFQRKLYEANNGRVVAIRSFMKQPTNRIARQ